MHAQNQITKPNYVLNAVLFLEKYIWNITLVNYCWLCIDYESNKHILNNNNNNKKKKTNEVLVIPVAIESL